MGARSAGRQGRDHPAKTQAWYDARRQKALDDGLLHVFAQEVDRDYAASVEGVIIPLEWVRAAIDAHVNLGFGDDGGTVGALDVAGGDTDGADRNAMAIRKGVVLKHLAEWGDRDPGVTTRRAVDDCRPFGRLNLMYDCIGVGAAVKSEANRLTDELLMPDGVRLVPWDAGSGPLNPDDHVIANDDDSPLNKDFYGNLKAQGWWELRLRFYRTWRAITDPTFTWKADELISLPSDLPLLRQAEKELAQPTRGQSGRLKLIVNKTPEGTRSPNIGDAIMMAYWPVPGGFDVDSFVRAYG